MNAVEKKLQILFFSQKLLFLSPPLCAVYRERERWAHKKVIYNCVFSFFCFSLVEVRPLGHDVVVVKLA